MEIVEILTTSTVTVGLFSAALWLGRTWIVARLTADIRLENDSKLEELKSQLQRANSALSDLTSAGHTAYSQVQVAILPHKIAAIDAVWKSVLAWNEMSTASMMVSALQMNWVKKYGSDPSTKTTFETILSAPGHLEFLKKRNETEFARPYVSERGWALYAAYSGFYMSRISKASMLLFPSIDHSKVWQRIGERELLVASAPSEILSLYDKNILQGTNAYLNYLKDEMISEFQSELSGTRDSTLAVANAASILDAAEKLVQSSVPQPANPQDTQLNPEDYHPTFQ